MPVNNTEPLSVYRAGPGYAKCLAGMILAACRAHRKRGFLDYLLELPDGDIVRLLTLLAAHPAQQWGRIDETYVALVDGVCSGTVTVSREKYTRDYPFTPEALTEVASRLGLAPGLVAEILARQKAYVDQMPAFDEPVPPGTWLVEYLGVRPENRAAGVARGLMARATREVRDAGGSALELYCDIGNTRAERLFASLGFFLVKEYRYRPELADLGDGARRLRLELGE
jgi:GNAT superfamily N-acetyltransferase